MRSDYLSLTFKRLLLLPAVCLLSQMFVGCVSSPSGDSPELTFTAPVSWAQAEEVVTNEVNSLWMHSIDDVTLDALIKEALLNNFDVQLAAVRLENARLNAVLQGADRYPSLNAGLQAGTYNNPVGNGTHVQTDSFDLGLSLGWELDLWGKLRDQSKAAQMELLASEEYYRAARLSIAANTAKAWFSALTAQLQLRLALRSLESYNESSRIIENRFEAGIDSALDLRLALTTRYGADALVAARKQEFDAAVRNLQAILGRYPSGELVMDAELPVVSDTVPAGLPSDLLVRRPDIVAAQNMFISSEYQVSNARKKLLPSIQLSGSAGTTSDDLGNMLNSDFSYWNLIGGLTQPIFNGGRLRAGVDFAELSQEQATIEYGQTVLNAFREVETYLTADILLADKEEALRNAAEQSQAAEELAWDQYTSGIVGIITVLESQRRNLQAQEQFLNAKRQRLNNRVDLHLSLGGGFEETPNE